MSPHGAGLFRDNGNMRLSLLTLCVGVFVPALLVASDPLTVEQIIAKVNGDIVTKSDIEKARREAEAGLRARGLKPQQIASALKEGEKDLLRDRIDNLLLIQRGKDLDLKIDSEVTKYLGQIQLENKIADPDKFAQWVHDQTGMSLEDFKAETRNGILAQRVVGQEVYGRVTIPKAQIEDFYNQNKASFQRKERIFLREIFISTQDKDAAGVAAADKKAKDLVARARKGERFGDLVRDNSEGITARQGGSLDPYEKGVLRPDMEAAVWEKPKGHVTDPIKVDAGWIILRVDDHQKEGQAELADVEAEIKERLTSQQVMPKLREYLTELRLNAFLEIREDFVDTGAAPGMNTAWNQHAMLKAETITKEEVALIPHIRRMFWIIPIPGTWTTDAGKQSTSK
jgi:parvulin-like peptidyl-prolyl isomerase